jgi:putative transport protein
MTPKPPSTVFKWVGVAIVVAIPTYLALTGHAGPEVRSHTVMGPVFQFLGKEQFALLFLVVTGGYLLGKVQFGGVGLGTTGATLILALEMSVWALAGEGIKFEITGFASTIFFNLFMFAIGMKVGPQFVSGIKGHGIKFVIIAVLIPVISFVLTLVLKSALSFQPGFAPGIMAGGNTATPGLGAAQTAYTSEGAAQFGDKTQEVLGNLSTSFAFSYAITIVAFVLLMKVLPRLFRQDAPAAARRYLDQTIGGSAPLPGEPTAFKVGTLPVATRSYALEKERFVGQPLRDLRAQIPMVAVERVGRDEQVLAPEDDLVLRKGDQVALFATVPRLLAAQSEVGPEIDAPELRETARETVELVVSTPELVGHKLGDLAKGIGHGVYVNAMFRSGVSIPFGPDLETEKGDVIRVTAGGDRIAQFERRGYRLVRPSTVTDMVTIGIGLAAGSLIGAITIPAGPISFALGSSVGLLVVGIALSAIRTRNPAFGGPFPEAARKLLEDMGLSVFIAILGLTSGTGVMAAITSGSVLPIAVSALIVGLLPPVLAWMFGLYVLRMNSALLLGAVAGGTASAAGLNAAQEAAESTVPAIAYPVAFSVGNILLTLLSYLLAVMD